MSVRPQRLAEREQVLLAVVADQRLHDGFFFNNLEIPVLGCESDHLQGLARFHCP
jgi:hypothetical protein